MESRLRLTKFVNNLPTAALNLLQLQKISQQGFAKTTFAIFSHLLFSMDEPSRAGPVINDNKDHLGKSNTREIKIR